MRQQAGEEMKEMEGGMGGGGGGAGYTFRQPARWNEEEWRKIRGEQPVHVRENRKLFFSASEQLGRGTKPGASEQNCEWVHRPARALNTTSS